MPKILFVGAGGAVADKVLPLLAKKYQIVGVGGKRDDLKQHCIEFYQCDLFTEHAVVFEEIFSRHAFDSIIWNPVRYFPGPLLETSRQRLHAEFDLAIALPLECLRVAIAHSFSKGTFTFVTSGLAFGVKPSWGSYSVVKRGQVILTEYLAQELQPHTIYPKAVALGSVPALKSEVITEAFVQAIENEDPNRLLYEVYH